MKEEQKKKLEELTQQRKKKLDEQESSVKKILEDMDEMKKETKQKFVPIRKAVFDFTKKAEDIVSETGDTVEFYSNDHADNLSDKIRTFAQMLFYPKGLGKTRVGYNTASIVFEANPNTGTLAVHERTSVKAAQHKLVHEADISEFNEERVTEILMNFLTEMLGK